jgi:hypothetical protein
MKKKSSAGNMYAIWVDQKKAIVSSIDHLGKIQTETIKSDVEFQVRFHGETSGKTRLFDTNLNNEKHAQNRHHNQLLAFLKEIPKRISKASSILILGPADTKYELHKVLEKKKSLHSANVEIKTADKMKPAELNAVLKARFVK